MKRGGGGNFASLGDAVAPPAASTVVILLRGGPRRFSELKREIGGVSQRMLTLTLRGLERDGIVTRTVYDTAPPRVDYELTRLGYMLLEPVQALGDWAFAHLDLIEQARDEFDRRSEEKPRRSQRSANASFAVKPSAQRTARSL